MKKIKNKQIKAHLGKKKLS